MTHWNSQQSYGVPDSPCLLEPGAPCNFEPFDDLLVVACLQGESVITLVGNLIERE